MRSKCKCQPIGVRTTRPSSSSGNVRRSDRSRGQGDTCNHSKDESQSRRGRSSHRPPPRCRLADGPIGPLPLLNPERVCVRSVTVTEPSGTLGDCDGHRSHIHLLGSGIDSTSSPEEVGQLSGISVVMQKGWPAGSSNTRQTSGEGWVSALAAPRARAAASARSRSVTASSR